MNKEVVHRRVVENPHDVGRVLPIEFRAQRIPRHDESDETRRTAPPLSPHGLPEEFQAPADRYLMKWILHDWDDADCVRILRNVAAAMPVGAKLVVVEGVQDRNAAHPRFSMLVVTEGGRERTVSEIQGLLTAAGLRPVGVSFTPADLALVEAVKGARACGET